MKREYKKIHFSIVFMFDIKQDENWDYINIIEIFSTHCSLGRLRGRYDEMQWKTYHRKRIPSQFLEQYPWNLALTSFWSGSIDNRFEKFQGKKINRWFCSTSRCETKQSTQLNDSVLTPNLKTEYCQLFNSLNVRLPWCRHIQEK